MFQSMMNQRKPGLESKNLHLRTVSANTPKKKNVVKVHKNDTTQQATNTGSKSSLAQAKWFAILRQHIEILDSHIKFLDQSLERVKCEKPNKLLNPELEESINWKMIYRVMDTAMEVLTRSREAAVGILPANEHLDDKNLDQKGNKSQRLETVSHWDKDIASSKSTDIISELDSSSIGSENADNQRDLRALPTPSHVGIKKLCLSRKSKKPKNDIRVDEEQRKNKRTKVDMDRFTTTPSKSQIYEAKEVNYTSSNKKMKKRDQLVEPEQTCEMTKAARSQRETTAALSTTEFTDIDVDFAAIEIKLQEEIVAGERAVREAKRSITGTSLSSTVSSKPRKKKRRRRSSDDLSRVRQVDKKLRREERKKIHMEKKRKVDEIEVDKEASDHKRKKIRKIPMGEEMKSDSAV